MNTDKTTVADILFHARYSITLYRMEHKMTDKQERQLLSLWDMIDNCIRYANEMPVKPVSGFSSDDIDTAIINIYKEYRNENKN